MNAREIASVVWLGGFLTWAAATMPDARAAFAHVVKAFVQPKVVGPVIVLAAWTAGLCALAFTVGLWKMDVLSDTVVWFLTVGMAFYFSLDKVAEDGWIGRTIRRAVAPAGLAHHLTFIVLLGLVAERDDEHRAAG